MGDEQSKSGGGSAGQSSASLAELQRMTDEIDQMIHELRDAQAGSRRLLTLGVLILVIIMLGWGWFTYQRMRENFTQSKLKAAMMIKADIIWPELETHLTATLHDVLPFYLKTGQDRLKTIMPRLEGRLKEEGDKLAPEIREQVSTQIDQRFQQIAEQATDQLGKEMPGLAGDAGQRVTDRIKQDMLDRGQKLRDRINTMLQDELSKTQTVLESFPIPDVRQEDSDQLVRQLLHTLIMYADYEVLATPAPATLDVNSSIPLDH